MDKIGQELSALLAAATAMAMTARGIRPICVTVHFPDGKRIVNFVPPENTESEEWIPTPLQRRIMDALKGTALHADDLAPAVHVDRRTLYKPGGVKELVARELVGKDNFSGYYSKAFPPKAIE